MSEEDFIEPILYMEMVSCLSLKSGIFFFLFVFFSFPTSTRTLTRDFSEKYAVLLQSKHKFKIDLSLINTNNF